MTITRSSNQGDLQYDIEIERTLRRLRREDMKNFEEHNLALDSLFASNFDLEEDEVMAENQTLKELAAPNLNQQPSRRPRWDRRPPDPSRTVRRDPR